MSRLASGLRRFGWGALLVAGLATAGAADEKAVWGKSLEEGIAAAMASGRAVLVVTLWKSGV